MIPAYTSQTDYDLFPKQQKVFKRHEILSKCYMLIDVRCWRHIFNQIAFFLNFYARFVEAYTNMYIIRQVFVL